MSNKSQDSAKWFGTHVQASRVKGGAWAMASNVLKAASQLVGAVILSRLLSPEQFGTFAVMLALHGLITPMIGQAFSTTLIQKRVLTEQEASNFLWLAVLGSGLCGVALAMIGPFIAKFFEDTIYISLAIAFAILVWLDTVGAQYQALAMRSLRFDILFRIQLISLPAALVAGVTSALVGLGTWALVIHMFVGSILARILLVRAIGWRPMRYSRAVGIRGMISFGARMSLGALTRLVYGRLPILLLAKSGGASAAGFYNRGDALFKRPFEQAVYPISSVLLPSMSSAAHDQTRLKHLAAQSIWLLTLAIGPLVAFMGMYGDWVAVLLLGAQWLEAGEVVRWMAVIAFSTIYRRSLSSVNAAVGRPARGVGLKLALLPIFFGLMLWAAPKGASYMASTMAIFYITSLPLEVLVLVRGLPIPKRPILSAFAGSLAVTVVVSAAIATLRMLQPEMIGPESLGLSELMLLIGVFVGSYALAFILAMVFTEARAIQLRMAILVTNQLRGVYRKHIIP